MENDHALILSALIRQSINDHILKEQYSLQYTSFDDAIRILTALGKGALMAKLTWNQHSVLYQYIQLTGSC